MISFLRELDQNRRHVVHTVLVSTVLWYQLVQEFLANNFKLFFIKPCLDPLYHLFVCLNLPYTIAAHNNKIYVLVFNLFNVRLCCDHLLLGRKGIVLFVFSVSQGSAEVKSTVDSSETHDTTCPCDSIDLLWVLRLVIFAQLLSLATHTGHSSGIASICAINKLWSDQNDVGCASCVRILVICGTILHFPHLLLNGNYLLSSCLTKNEVIHSQESLLESEFIVALFVIWICL